MHDSLGSWVIIESIATLTVCRSSFLTGDKAFHMSSVRIKEIMIPVGPYSINLCVFPCWRPAGDFLLHPVGAPPGTVDMSHTTQLSYDVYSHYCHRPH